MKRITIIITLCIALGMFSSFIVNKAKSDEEVTVYVYAYTPIKDPYASVFTPVFRMTVPKREITLYADGGRQKLEQKLDKYIAGELGKERLLPYRLCCGYWYYSMNEAEEARYKDMASQRDKKNEIWHTGVGFSFSYHWKD